MGSRQDFESELIPRVKGVGVLALLVDARLHLDASHRSLHVAPLSSKPYRRSVSFSCLEYVWLPLLLRAGGNPLLVRDSGDRIRPTKLTSLLTDSKSNDG